MTQHTLSIPSFERAGGFERLEVRGHPCADSLDVALFGTKEFLQKAGRQLLSGLTTAILDGRVIRLGGGNEAALISPADAAWLGVRVPFSEDT